MVPEMIPVKGATPKPLGPFAIEYPSGALDATIE